MLLWLAEALSDSLSLLNLVQYITLRAAMAMLTAMLVCLLFGSAFIRWLQANQFGEVVLKRGPDRHQSKQGTPTLGGVLILFALVLAVVLWGDLQSRYIRVLLFVVLAFGGLGLIDDWFKLRKPEIGGLSMRTKFLSQMLLAAIAAAVLFQTADLPQETAYLVPFFKDVSVQLGMLGFVSIGCLVIVGSSNAVNLTDGLDGLAILPAAIIGAALGAIAYITGHHEFASYLLIPYLPGTGELVVFVAALVGAALGFLWFNTYPAMVFMGDVGSLALGAVLGVLAVIVRHEILFAIMGGLLVLEVVSVILQVASFKLLGRRLFRMSPIYHHFELLGWPEPHIIVRFWIGTIVLVIIGLSTLKLR